MLSRRIDQTDWQANKSDVRPTKLKRPTTLLRLFRVVNCYPLKDRIYHSRRGRRNTEAFQGSLF